MWMRRAVELAKTAGALTHPNPLVGAVVVEAGEVLAEAYHKAFGKCHAEVAALKQLEGRNLKRACLYVTLEPCCHRGKTPPCTEAILASGIQKVVVGQVDPHRLVRGKGIARLREGGLEVRVGVLEKTCRALNLVFNYYRETGKPLIAAKMATSLDGATATGSGQSKWLSNALAREHLMSYRALFPALAVGSETARLDDPALTVRKAGEKPYATRRFVLDRRGRTAALPLRLYQDAFKDATVLVTCSAQTSPVEIWRLSREGFPQAFADKLVESEIQGVLLEGGTRLISAFLKAGLLRYLFCYQGPHILGNTRARGLFEGLPDVPLEEAVRLVCPERVDFGDTILSHGFLKLPEKKS